MEGSGVLFSQHPGKQARQTEDSLQAGRRVGRQRRSSRLRETLETEPQAPWHTDTRRARDGQTEQRRQTRRVRRRIIAPGQGGGDRSPFPCGDKAGHIPREGRQPEIGTGEGATSQEGRDRGQGRPISSGEVGASGHRGRQAAHTTEEAHPSRQRCENCPLSPLASASPQSTPAALQKPPPTSTTCRVA
ncbi:hypothetical protein NDU88_003319 [Pleurodeles waltl]|uniref:Uncharacterized protein n=1 Tax=Pleurodeles waltl TaxID=8319 RepID=A0AAV7SD45_PLEWA|nr:hypothetical protein NDU88_003319 [Pleurodeles waltl]